MRAKRILVHALALVGLAALVVGGLWLWRQRPWRVVVSVNGRTITSGELDLRAQTLMNDERRFQHLTIAPGHEAEALRHYRRQAAKMWIVKEVLLAEAVARGYEVSASDEAESLQQVASALKSRGMTPEEFFREGPLPEEVKRRDFKEGVLIHKFSVKEVREKISVTTKEIDDYQADLRRLSLLKTKPGEKPRIRSDRKTAIDLLRADRFRKGFRALFRALYEKADVKAPEFPELETLEGVSPARLEDAPGGGLPVAAPPPPDDGKEAAK